MNMRVADYVELVQRITALRCPKGKKVKESWIPSVADKTGKKEKKIIPLAWDVIDSRETKNAVEIALRVPVGYSIDDIKKESDAIYAACGTPVTFMNRGAVAVLSFSKYDFPKHIAFKPEFLDLTKGRQIVCGFDINDKPVIHDFRVPHMLMGAMAGYGKTDFLRWLILQLIHRFTPEQLHIDIIDGKGFSFLPFKNIPHIRRIVRDVHGALSVLEDAKKEMNARTDKVLASNDRNATALFQWRIVIIDEMAVLSPDLQVTKDDKAIANKAYANMCAIACVGREASVGIVMCTQRPDANVVHPQVKANCDVSIAFKVKTNTNSEIILGRSGAEKLPHNVPGRGIYSATEDTIFQVPYIGNDDVWYEVLEPYKVVKEDEPGAEEIDNLDGLI